MRGKHRSKSQKFSSKLCPYFFCSVSIEKHSFNVTRNKSLTLSISTVVLSVASLAGSITCPRATIWHFCLRWTLTLYIALSLMNLYPNGILATRWNTLYFIKHVTSLLIAPDQSKVWFKELRRYAPLGFNSIWTLYFVSFKRGCTVLVNNSNIACRTCREITETL